MAIEAPYPDLDEMLMLIGKAGHRLSEIEATEGAAGNISVYIGWPLDPRRKFPIEEPIELPEPAPELEGKAFLVTGSGRRLREIIEAPAANLGFVVVRAGGTMGTLYTAPGRLFAKLTSEWNSHLAVHRDYVARSGTNFHAIVHAQPLHLTYLSHIPRYQDTVVLSRQLLRWQPESIVNLPEGIGFIPFTLPGSPALMAATVDGLRRHRIVVWAKHGVMARSDLSVKRAGDRIEYAETGARYEYMNLVSGEPGVGLTPEQIRAICATLDIEQTIF
jgi:rhamnulose-1-phosphate aldolase